MNDVVYTRKARRCYRKAFELDQHSPEAGSSLVEVLMRLDEKVRC